MEKDPTRFTFGIQRTSGSFPVPRDTVLRYSHYADPAYIDALVTHMNIKDDIATTMNGHADWNRSSPVIRSSTIVFNVPQQEQPAMLFFEKHEVFAVMMLHRFYVNYNKTSYVPP